VLLRPLVLGALALGVPVLWLHSEHTEAWMADQVERRAEFLLQNVRTQAEVAPNLGAVQRLTMANGADRHVLELVFAGGTPLRVLASSRRNWLNLPVTALPDDALRDAIHEATASESKRGNVHRQGGFGMAFTSTLAKPEFGLDERGPTVFATVIDQVAMQRDLTATELRLWLPLSIALGLIAGYLLFLVERRLVRPITRLNAAVLRWRSGTIEPAVEQHSHELQLLSTALHTSFEALATEQARTSAILQAAGEGILTIDDTGTVEGANPAAARLFGCGDGELRGKQVAELLPGFAGLEALRAAIGLRREGVGRRADRQQLTLSIAVTETSYGSRHHLVCVLRDVSIEQQAREELRRSAEQMAAANATLARAAAETAHTAAMKSEFLATMSHEIRTPMTAILGFAENLLDPTLSSTDREQAAQTILRNGDHLLTILNDILDLSKLEAGKLTLEPLPCDVHELARDAAELVRARAEARGLRLALRVAPTAPRLILTDPTRVRQILLNLLSNAVKFTREGEVTLAVGAAERQGAQWLTIEVRDTGIGMDQDAVARLFAPFMQAERSTARHFGGTGLGLSICKQLAELLGGAIQVESSPGRGSTFTLALPARRVEVPAQPSSTAPLPASDAAPAASLEGVHVLLADDGADNRRLITHILRRAGATVLVAEDGAQAVALAEAASRGQVQLHAILMDMQMPVVDGYEATRRLRAAGQTMPILALTAHAGDADRQRCLAAGCDAFASKPVDRRKLLATLREAIDQQRTGPLFAAAAGSGSPQ
jgi:PAS domain S-box-containing protein